MKIFGAGLVAAWTAMVVFPATASAQANVESCFDGLLPEVASIETVGHAEAVDQVCWSKDNCCGDDVGCCDAGCGDTCGSACGCCTLPANCGLLGQGILTHDPCGAGCVLPKKLLGWFSCKSETAFDEFVSPMTNPIFFEDPRQLTEMRAFFWQHKVPLTAGGGDVNLYAVQLRARVSDRLSLIASKDGYVVSTNPFIDDGWADVDVGFKYTLHRDARRQRLLAGGVVYEMPVGTPRTLQAKGDGEFHLFLTGGAKVACNTHWLSSVGGVIPVDSEANSHFMYWSNHLDYQFRRGWYAVGEVNWFHWTSGGNDALGLTGVEGFDAFNLGSAAVGGNDIVTGAVGLKYKPTRKTEVGVAWEVPLTDRRDIIDNRLTVDLIFRY